MVKKYILVIIMMLVTVLIFTNYEKNNPTFKKVLNSNITRTTDSSVSITPADNSTGKQKKIFLQVNEPKENTIVNSQAITVTGKTIPLGFIFVNDQEFKADSNGNFSTTVILDEGENYILIVVSDEYGNSLEKDILVNLETTQ